MFLKRFAKSFAPRLDRWVNDGIFQLQRRAFEANEDIAWIDLEKEIPFTAEKTFMSELPTMRRPSRRSVTAATLVDKNAIMEWELEKRQTRLPELDRSISAVSVTSSTERDLVSR